MYAATWGGVISDLRPRLVRVEVDVSRGLPAFEIVGRPARVVKESRDRVRAALRNCGLDFPARRITVNLAPADFPKAQSFLDLPIALGILAASGQLDLAGLHDCLFAGELSLAGSLSPIQGCLAISLLAAELNLRLVCPVDNLADVEQVGGLQVAGFSEFAALIRSITEGRTPWRFTSGNLKPSGIPQDPWAANSLVGGVLARRCLTIAAAGSHNLALVGPPGVGKTLLAKVLHGLLPPLSQQECLEVAELYSAVGLAFDQLLKGVRPFRSPHHSLTRAGLIGGGIPTKPGELSLAHRGLLFLDELPLFQRSVLQALREPLEAKQVALGRCARQVILPADVQLVCAFNLCPCGYHYFQPERCCCSPHEVQTFLRPVVGPLADRIDLRLAIAKPLWEDQSPSNAAFAHTVAEARDEVQTRGDSLEKRMPRSAGTFLRALIRTGNLSARAYFRLLSVASTISALEGSELISEEHLAEAYQFRWELPGRAGGENSDVL